MRKVTPLIATLILVSLITSCGGENKPPEDMTWISPGKVQVGNFYPGAWAEWPLLVHNGNDYIADFAVDYRYPDHVDEGCYKTVEFSYECPDCTPLEDYGCWVDYTGGVWNCPNEESLRIGYCALETEEEISGCISSVYKLKYACNSGPRAVTEVDTTGQKVTYECQGSLGKPSLEYLCPECQYWVIVADPTPVLMPYETREILITLPLPNYAGAPWRWEFWISVMDTSQGGMVQTELCSRWLVTMQ